MAFDFKKLTKEVANKAESVSKSVQSQLPESVLKDMKDIAGKADAMAKSVQEQLPDSMKNIDVKASVMNMAKKSSDALAKFSAQEAKTDRSAEEALIPETEQKIIGYREALRVIYYLMSVDHAVSPEEVEKFVEIGKDMDPLFMNYKQTLIDTCQLAVNNSVDDEDYYDNVHDLVGDILKNADAKPEKGITGKMLYWNLLAVAYSDGGYSEDEKRLIRYISKILNIGKEITLELENTLKTLIEIDKEEEYLKQSGRPYLEVSRHVEELAQRRNAIMQGVLALIED